MPTTRIGAALKVEMDRRSLTQVEASALLGIRQQTLSLYLNGKNIPTIDPRRLAAFLHHEDGRAWTVEEVLETLEEDRRGR